MKRLAYFALPIMVLLMFLFLPNMGFTSAAQTGERIASPSNVEPETESVTEMETEPETEMETEPETEMETEPETEIEPEPDTELDSDKESQAVTNPNVPDKSKEIPETEYRTASPSNAFLAPDSAPMEITEIETDKHSVNRVQLLMRGHSSATLTLQLEETVNFYKEGEGFSEKGVKFSINYETEDFDLTYRDQAGLFFLKASILLEDERYAFAPEVSTDIMIPVFLYDADQPAFLPPLDPDRNDYDSMETFNLVAEVHTDLQQVTDRLIHDYPYKLFYLYFEDGYYLAIPNAWDMTSVKTDVPGVYKAYRRPELPQGVLMDEIPEAACSINIQDSSVFTLSPPRSFGNNIVTTWLYPTPDRSLFRAWYCIGESKWTEDKNEYLMRLVPDGSSCALFINPWEMKKDIHYQFQLEYNGVYSNVLDLCANQDGFYIPNEGDRDGADRDDQTDSGITQQPGGDSSGSGHSQGSSGDHSSSPKTGASSDGQTEYGPGYSELSASVSKADTASESEADTVPKSEADAASESEAVAVSESEPVKSAKTDSIAAISGQTVAEIQTPSSSEPSAAMEADTATATTWSGTRIQDHLKAFPGLPIVFEKDHIRLSMPADSPALVNMSHTDYLHVEIQAVSMDTVGLTINLNEIPLSGLPITVKMPWAETVTGDFQVKNETGDVIGKADYISMEHSITFTVEGTGLYTVVPVPEKAAESAPEKAQVPTLPAASNPAMKPGIPSEQADRYLLPVTVIPAIFLFSGVIVFRRHKHKED